MPFSPPSAAAAVGGLVLLAALARHDFSFTYVADHTSRELPLGYTLAAFWGGQQGSLLLWLLVLTGLGSAALALNPRLDARGSALDGPDRRRHRDVLRAPARASSPRPFATQAPPADGVGLNPSLQNPYMLAHPPLLYLGYVGLTDPVRLRDGSACLAPGGRAVDRCNPTLDARRLDVPRRSRSCSARSGPTRRSAGAAGTPGTPSRTPR